MTQILGIFEVILDSGVLIPGLALAFGFYIAYILLSARNVFPMTKEEAETLWKFHKQKDCYKAEKWHEVIKRNKIVGYECECGFRHIQNKHLVAVG